MGTLLGDGWRGLDISGAVLQLGSGLTTGYYETPSIDMGFSARAKALLKVDTSQTGSDDPTWDAATWTWDSETGQTRTWDGPVGLDILTVLIQAKYSTTKSGLTTETWKTYIPEERTFRWCKFKVTLTIPDVNFSASLDDLLINLEAVQIINRKETETIPDNSNPHSVTYGTSFVDSTTIGLSVSLLGTNLVAGDYLDITNRSTTGFDVRVRDSAGAIRADGNARAISYTAIGY